MVCHCNKNARGKYIYPVLYCGRKFLKPLVICGMPHAHGSERGSYNPFARFSNGQTTFMPSLWSREQYDQEPRRLGAGGALTVLRFVPVRGCVRVLVFTLK
jgi:hypothetical protein